MIHEQKWFNSKLRSNREYYLQESKTKSLYSCQSHNNDSIISTNLVQKFKKIVRFPNMYTYTGI